MATPFLSSEEYDERAHQLYNEGQYDEALDVLREGLALYPNAVELHIGVGYAYHAREEYAWARRSFEEALVLDPEHEDALAGLGETLLKFGQQAAALKSFHHTLELGYEDARKIKPGIRVLFMSASPMHPLVVDEILPAGHRFLAKPFTARQLLEAVRGALFPQASAH